MFQLLETVTCTLTEIVSLALNMEVLPINRIPLPFSLVTFTTVLLLHLPSSSNSYPTFEVPSSNSEISQELYNLVVEPTSGALFVGALNRIYKLPPDLGEGSIIETGPRPDNQECPVPPRKCDRVLEDTDNINKILVLDDDRLITCGSIYQGTCQVRSPENLEILANSTSGIAPNTVSGTVVAFVTSPSTQEEKVLFVGTSKGHWQDFLYYYTISGRELPRNLSQKNLLEIVKNENGIGTLSKLLFPHEDSATRFNIEYIHGFSVDHFSYFIANQPEESDPVVVPENYTKIVQICQNERRFYSYIELPLNCKNPATGEKYNLAQAAHVIQIGSSLGWTGFEDSEEVLFAAFSKGKPNSMEPSGESAVCMYPIRLIKKMFFDRRIECFEGETEETEIMWWESQDCPTGSKRLVEFMREQGTGYCHNIDYMWPMGGNDGYDGDAIYMDSSGITALTATHHNNYTVIFLGDSNGYLKKITKEAQDEAGAVKDFGTLLYQRLKLRVQSESLANLYEGKNIDDGSPVAREGLKFSADEEFLYVMTQRKITKVPVAECDQYTDCEQCLNVANVGDPYCGWCSLQSSCTRRLKSECTGAESTSSLHWTQSHDGCPNITEVTPPNTPSTEVNETLLMEKIPCAQIIDNGPCNDNVLRFAYNAPTLSCESFVFGGCGGTSNNFLSMKECNGTCVTDVCAQPAVTCAGNETGFSYDPASGVCVSNTIGAGCTANSNFFATQSACQERCEIPVCSQAIVAGPCSASVVRFAYNSGIGQCQQFSYSGCGGTANRFDSLLECAQNCEAEACAQPINQGPCPEDQTRFGFNPEIAACEPFRYGGCLGNENLFLSFADCQNQCTAPICSQAIDSGPCRRSLPRFGFSFETGQCEQFTYSGCGGTINRFRTLADCQQRCKVDDIGEVCSKIVDPGSCSGNLVRFYYNPTVGNCQPFIYGGCAGNTNNFMSDDACTQRCVTDVCAQPLPNCPGALTRWGYNSTLGECVSFNYDSCQDSANLFTSQEECRLRCEAAAHTTTETMTTLGLLFWVILFMVIFFTIMALVIFIIIRFRAANLNRKIENIYENNRENILRHSELESEVDILLKDKEVSNDKVILLEMLGKGEFGVVYKGVVNGIRGTNEEVICAVKMPKVGALNDSEAKEYLLSEMKLLADLGDHQNILSLLACSTRKEPYYLITEFMKFGDLLTFLRKCRKRENAETDPTYNVEGTRQVFIAYQIANGMAYIEEKRFYHGDLAARNILVGDDLSIKISDFGLADDIYTRGYKHREVGRKIPIKWCSLETILKGMCTSQGDVWSFGILLYEVFTLGGTPYPGLAARYLVSQLRKGYRMEQPEDCPDDIYELMFSCWKEDPNDRPTFHAIREELDGMLVKRSDYLEVEQEDETFNDTAEGDHFARASYMSYIFNQSCKSESVEQQRREGAAAVERFAPILEEENDIELTELEAILHNEH